MQRDHHSPSPADKRRVRVLEEARDLRRAWEARR